MAAPSANDAIRSCHLLTHARVVVRMLLNRWADTEDDWWEGTLNGKQGAFPSNYVELL